MKHLKWASILGASALLVGCDQNTDNASTSEVPVVRDDALVQSRSGDTNYQLSETSREGASSRVFSSDTNSASDAAADNTGRNVRDRNDATLTPGDQGNTEADIDITRKLRRALTADDNLSVAAKNIKIITANGKVTLRGPVNSEQEKQAIEAMAKQQGLTGIDNQLEVKQTNQ